MDLGDPLDDVSVDLLENLNHVCMKKSGDMGHDLQKEIASTRRSVHKQDKHWQESYLVSMAIAAMLSIPKPRYTPIQ